ncbi:MAG: 16S rRNA (cytidine(1402)-2'-O)-methyltransferase [Proteobacteria bacterium]|nr:16S rRNA (cytidine(1402)-2'-O)-methyltransferase [Pseudomonadota bacterium]MDA1063026.1 16S rRNA (cytidine(1402)-2'-O)-methyltransferase [Pseudomonadota bacterium]
MTGTLFVVATPIGNLEDLSPRARQTLEAVDLIAAEDTRHTGRLLSHFGVKTPLFALHDHNEEKVVQTLMAELIKGKSVALVSDAGTPLISDPGYRLVSGAHANAIRVVPVAGPCAVTVALSAAGLPTDRYCFEGFLPAKQKARRDRIAALVRESRSIVIYESVHRIRDCFADLVAAFGDDRPAFVGRELTKMHEQCVQAPLAGLLRQLDEGDIPAKGEFVLIVTGSDETPALSLDIDDLLRDLAEHLPPKTAAKIAANATGESRNDLYRRLLMLADRK